MMTKYELSADTDIKFNNNVDFCVGTGRFGLALCKEYIDNLRFVQENIGFKHIRGHGLFSDDTAIYHEYESDGRTEVEYNFTYADRVIDEYISLGIRPFIELGFMPGKLASGTQTVFYWKGNTTPPKDYEKWTDMVTALLAHLCERYGEGDVLEWPIEVWNEPNLPGFWLKADMQEYFVLFEKTFRAIKALNDRFTVGGPAICGVNDETWMREFLNFCREKDLHPDFITRHHYFIEFPERVGRYDYSALMEREHSFGTLDVTRAIVDSFEEYKGLPIHITEFNSSYTPTGVIHDTNLNAALLARQLSRLGDVNESYSYWTFSDVFEESGVPFSQFHGGFGLVAAHNIPKPTFWSFKFFKDLQDKGNNCVLKNDNAVVVKTEKGYAGVLWNESSEEEYRADLCFEVLNGDYTLITKTVDPVTTNPLKTWHDLGEPATPRGEMVELIRASAYPYLATKRISAENKKAEASFAVRPEGVVYFEIMSTKMTSDRGYDYEKVLKTR